MKISLYILIYSEEQVCRH